MRGSLLSLKLQLFYRFNNQVKNVSLYESKSLSKSIGTCLINYPEGNHLLGKGLLKCPRKFM